LTELKISEAASMLGVSDDTLRRWAEAGRIPLSKSASGRMVVRGPDLAALAQDIAAEPRAVTASPASAASARNRMRGIVTKVTRDTVMAQVELQAGPFRIVSLMSREAADELGLEVGTLAIATVKATNVVVELPEHQ
jgi:molybdopterin-binding protein